MQRKRFHPSGVQILRWILLVAVCPLWVLALRHVADHDATLIDGLSFSPDSKRLNVFRGERKIPQWQLNESSCEIQVWNIATSQRIHRHVTGHGIVESALDGEHFVDVSRDRQVRLISPSFQVLQTWDLPASIGRINRVMCTDQLLIVNSMTTPNPTSNLTHVTCIDRSDGHVVKQWSSGLLREHVAGNGRRLFISSENPQTRKIDTEVFDTDGRVFRKLDVPSMPGTICTSDFKGETALLYSMGKQFSLTLCDLNHRSEHTWITPPSLQSPFAIFLTNDKEIRVLHGTRSKISTHDPTSNKPIDDYQLSKVSSPVLVHATSPDQKLIAGSTDYRQIYVWQLETGRCVARLPDHRVIRGCLGIGVALWCVAWVTSGTKVKAPKPWLDLVPIHVFSITILTFYAVVRTRDAIDPVVVAVSIAYLAALTAMLVAWWVYGGMRWSVRLAGLIGGLGILAAILLASPHRAHEAIWNIVIGAVSYVDGLGALLTWLRWRGFIIAANELPVEPSSGPQSSRMQIPLRDVLLLTAGIAVFISALRLVVPSTRPMEMLTYVTIHGLAMAVVLFTSVWAAFSSSPLPLRVSVNGIAAFVGGVLPTMSAWGRRVDPLFWCEVLFLLAAGITFLSLSVYRLHGYRLVRVMTVV